MNNLKQKTVSSIKWNGFATVAQFLVQMAQMIILAHYLSTKDFGLMAIVVIFTAFGQLLFDSGVSNAVIYKQNITQDQLSSLYWLNVMVSFGVYILLLVITPLIVYLYHQDQLGRLLPLCGIIFLCMPFSQIYSILMQKNLMFQKISHITIVSLGIGFVVSIDLARHGWGVYAMAYGSIASSLTQSILYVYFGRKWFGLKLHFSLQDIKPFLSFGFYQLGEKIINFFSTRVDQLLIGSLLGVNALGFYSLAFSIIIKPVYLFNQMITRVMFPVFSNIQSNRIALKKAYLKMLEFIIFVIAPLMFGVSFLAMPIVYVFLGEKWLPSAPLIEIIAFAGLLRATGNPSGALLLSLGYADVGFYWNNVIICSQIIGVSIGGYFFGLIGVAYAILFLQVCYFFPAYYFLIRKCIGPCCVEYISKVFKFIIIASFMWFILKMFQFSNHDSVGFIVKSLLIGSVSYFLMIFIVDKSFLKEYLYLLLHKNDKNYT